MTRKTGSVEFTEADGHQLAVDMLREIEAHYRKIGALIESWPDSRDNEIGDFWKQDKSEILRRYLGTVAAKGSPALEHGFFAVLTDYIGSTQGDGVVPEPEYYASEMTTD